MYLVLQLQTSSKVVLWMLAPLQIAGQCPAGKRPWSRAACMRRTLMWRRKQPELQLLFWGLPGALQQWASRGAVAAAPPPPTLCGHGALPGHPMAGAAGGMRWHARLEPTTSSALCHSRTVPFTPAGVQQRGFAGGRCFWTTVPPLRTRLGCSAGPPLRCLPAHASERLRNQGHRYALSLESKVTST